MRVLQLLISSIETYMVANNPHVNPELNPNENYSNYTFYQQQQSLREYHVFPFIQGKYSQVDTSMARGIANHHTAGDVGYWFHVDT